MSDTLHCWKCKRDLDPDRFDPRYRGSKNRICVPCRKQVEAETERRIAADPARKAAQLAAYARYRDRKRGGPRTTVPRRVTGDPAQTLTCNGCGKSLPPSAYSPRRTATDGSVLLHSACKRCRARNGRENDRAKKVAARLGL